MVLRSAGRVQRFQSNEASFDGITDVFKEFSTTILKISCSVGEIKECRRFFESESFFLTETHMFLRSVYRVQRNLSNMANFEGITRVFKELSTIIPLISCSVGEIYEILDAEFDEFHPMWLVLKK